MSAARLHHRPTAIRETARAERHLIGDLMPEAVMLHERFGGHYVFYALLAKRLGAPLVTADGPLARAAKSFGVDVRYVPPAR